MFHWLRHRSRWEGVNYLDLIPRRAVDHEPGGTHDKVVLLQPRYRDPILGRWLQPRLGPRKRWLRIPLDVRGSWLWSQIDGVRTVGALAAAFPSQFTDESEQIPERVSQYLAALNANGFVDFLNMPPKR